MKNIIASCVKLSSLSLCLVLMHHESWIFSHVTWTTWQYWPLSYHLQPESLLLISSLARKDDVWKFFWPESRCSSICHSCRSKFVMLLCKASTCILNSPHTQGAMVNGQGHGLGPALAIDNSAAVYLPGWYFKSQTRKGGWDEWDKFYCFMFS